MRPTAKKQSDTSVTPRRRPNNASQKRQKLSDTSVMDTPITDRKKLFDIRNWTNELHALRSFRWIAAHTWRGPKAFGWFEQISKGEHLKQKPNVRARLQDWHDLQLLRRTVRDFAEADSELFDATLAIVEARAQLDLRVANLLALARKRVGEKV